MKSIAIKELTGHHVLIGLAGFFGVMLIVNGIFLYFALSTFSGLENPNAYRDGLYYNERIEAARRQSALGWSHDITLKPDGQVEALLRNSAGAPVRGLAVSGTIDRPVASQFSQALAFREDEPGRYVALATGLAPGAWIVSIEGGEQHSTAFTPVYRAKERLWLKPSP